MTGNAPTNDNGPPTRLTGKHARRNVAKTDQPSIKPLTPDEHTILEKASAIGIDGDVR